MTRLGKVLAIGERGLFTEHCGMDATLIEIPAFLSVIYLTQCSITDVIGSNNSLNDRT